MVTRILIADDHTLVRGLLKALLESRTDWQVCAEAGDGLVAIQKTFELRPDLVILDVGMPGLDGLRVAKEIATVSPNLPVLIYTNYTFSPEAKLEARKLGVWDVVNKGVSGDQLLRAVEALLGPPPRAEAAVASAAIDLPTIEPKPEIPQT